METENDFRITFYPESEGNKIIEAYESGGIILLQKVIEKINEDFLCEAINSPRLLEDMASMEKYMAESYNSRIFIELLQNADDSYSSKIKLCNYDGHLIFANNGKPFDEKDVVAISRSGASTKERGDSIGYRGVGFKSTTYLTNEIIIYSNNTYFTFSKSLCSKKLNIEESKVPTVRIPFLVERVDTNIKKYVESLVNDGYSTIFVFKNAKIDDIVEEVKEINNGYFIFLNNISYCEINVKDQKLTFEIERNRITNSTIVSLLGKKKEQWLVVGDTQTTLAFKYESGRVIPCDEKEAVYHCYLPTLDRTMFPIKINGNFSTDPSRKHLTIDDDTIHSLELAAKTIYRLVTTIFNNGNDYTYSNILSILNRKLTFSKANVILNASFTERITKNNWLRINSKKIITLSEYKLFPDWLENSEKNFIRANSEYVKKRSIDLNVYKNINEVDYFLQQFSQSKYTTEDFITIMQEESFINNLNAQTHGKIIGNIIKLAKSEQFIKNKQYQFDNILVRCNDGINSIAEVSQEENIFLDKEMKNAIVQNTSKGDLEWFSKMTSIKREKLINYETSNGILYAGYEIKKVNVRKRPLISKWRSAEQHCVEIEKYFGNKAIDVSKQNVGYDVESTTADGKKRYIEVKSLNSIGSPFAMTNNEYTAAHQYGENYYLCLITQTEVNVSVIYIQNPLKNIDLEKRIRQWEWYCESYNGEEYIFKF